MDNEKDLDTSGDFDMHAAQGLQPVPPPPNVIDMFNRGDQIANSAKAIADKAVQDITAAQLNTARKQLDAATAHLRGALRGEGLSEELWEEGYALKRMIDHVQLRLKSVIDQQGA